MSAGAAAADLAVSTLREMKLKGEVYLEENLIFSAAVASGKVESLESKEELGAGIRIFTEGRIGFSHTADLSAAGVRAAAEAALGFAAHADAEAANTLPAPGASDLPDPETGEGAVAAIEAYRKVALARAMEEAARAADPRVTKVRQARYTDVVGRVEIRNTEGFAAGAAFARIYGSIELVAESAGEAQSGWANDFALRFGGLDPFRIGREAARRACAKLGGVRASTRRADVVFDPEAIGNLLEEFSPVLAADGVLKGKSIMAGRVGQKVASPAVSLIDDGRLPGANRTFPFDGEGFPTRRTVLVEGGLLKGYLHTAYTAARMGGVSAGNAFRSSYMGPPRVGPSTLYLLPSGTSRAEILRSVEEGILVTELMGLHTVDAITGEFSLGAAGHFVRKGEIGQAVTGVGLAGNLLGFLEGVGAVGSDLKLLPGGSAGSTTLVRGLTIAGS